MDWRVVFRGTERVLGRIQLYIESMNYEGRLEELREKYRKTAEPVKKEILIRQARAIKIAMGGDKNVK